MTSSSRESPVETEHSVTGREAAELALERPMPAKTHTNIHIHVLMRDERRKNEASKVKHIQTRQNKAKQHSTPKTVTFPK